MRNLDKYSIQLHCIYFISKYWWLYVSKKYLYYSAHVTQTIYSPKMQKKFFSTKANGQCMTYFVLYTYLLCPCVNRHHISTADPSKMSVFQIFYGHLTTRKSISFKNECLSQIYWNYSFYWPLIINLQNLFFLNLSQKRWSNSSAEN